MAGTSQLPSEPERENGAELLGAGVASGRGCGTWHKVPVGDPGVTEGGQGVSPWQAEPWGKESRGSHLVPSSLQGSLASPAPHSPVEV